MKKRKLTTLTTLLLCTGIVMAPIANITAYADDFDTLEYVSDEDDAYTDEAFADEDETMTLGEDTFEEDLFIEETELNFDTETSEETDETKSETETEAETETELEFESESTDEFAAGNTIASATPYTFGRKVKGNISSSNTVDYYKVTLKQSGRITINYNWYMRYSSIWLCNANQQVLSKTQQYLSWDSNINQGSKNMTYDLTAGTYYFAVARRYDANGKYDFKINYTASGATFDESQSNRYNTKERARQINANRTYKGLLGINDTVDYYKFTLRDSGLIQLSINSKCWDTYVKIYDSNNNEVSSGDVYRSDTGVGSYSVSKRLKSGTYYVVISIRETYSDRSGDYNFNYTFKSANETIRESVTDPYNTQRTAQSISLGKKYNGQLADTNDDHDFYKFTLSKPSVITLNANSEMRRIAYRIIDSNGATKYGSDTVWWNNAGYGHLLKSVDLPAGTYYLAVTKDGGCSGNYDFKIEQNAKYKVTYNVNCSGKVTGFPKTEVVLPGDQHKVTSTVPERNGYRFDGWYTAKNGGTRVYAGNEVKISGNTTYYAHWTMKGGVEGFVTRMYKVCLLRDPETNGYNYWINKLRSGQQTGRQVAYGFIFSNEFVGRKYSNEDYVERLYEAFLGRKSDANGKKYWLNKMKKGASRKDVFNGFVDSNEFNKICRSYGIKVK